MGNGTLPTKALPDEDEATWIEIPQQHYIPGHSTDMSTLIATTYPNFLEKWNDENYLKERAILTPLNTTAEDINQDMYKLLPGEEKAYTSCDEICQASQDSDAHEIGYPTEFLNTLTFPGMPNHLLTLKCGTPVLLLKNINPTLVLCNGTRLIGTDRLQPNQREANCSMTLYCKTPYSNTISGYTNMLYKTICIFAR
ncbi:unnamed protein product [Cuscuta campestris]|uniref:DNA helicase Pif1-like 2B domain-containing protein n=1 Tax=Cuscuta campestris TaxID=132261 RepID=A0A484MDV2_9ASTE|nr:unnamed protein product [Cuscuta campestris]